MRIDEGTKLDFDDVLIKPQRSDIPSREFPVLTRKFRFAHSPIEWQGVPLIVANMDVVGTFDMAKAAVRHKMLVALQKHYTVDELVEFFANNPKVWKHVFYTVGIHEEDVAKLKKVKARLKKQLFPTLLCIDVSNGYTQPFVDAVRKYRKMFPKSIIMAGNVCTPNMTEELILSGADIVKVGIGSGSVCTTRIKTGVGYPQLSAVDECSFVAHGKPHGHICSDGGIRSGGDAAKAFAAGSDFVMCGGIFAGTDECAGEWEEDMEFDENMCPTGRFVRKSLKFYGMSSIVAQQKYHGGLKAYRAAEGKVVRVPYKGSMDDVVLDILGGIRGACTMVGASCLKDLPKCASFVRVVETHNKVFGPSI